MFDTIDKVELWEMSFKFALIHMKKEDLRNYMIANDELIGKYRKENNEERTKHHQEIKEIIQKSFENLNGSEYGKQNLNFEIVMLVLVIIFLFIWLRKR